jgi:DNA polymerase-3 subunit epsilon
MFECDGDEDAGRPGRFALGWGQSIRINTFRDERNRLKFSQTPPAHTALGEVLTVIDLMQQVLRPLAERRGLDTWEKIVGFTSDEWFPSRLSFGKFKGRLYQEAGNDGKLKSWLECLAESRG